MRILILLFAISYLAISEILKKLIWGLQIPQLVFLNMKWNLMQLSREEEDKATYLKI